MDTTVASRRATTSSGGPSGSWTRRALVAPAPSWFAATGPAPLSPSLASARRMQPTQFLRIEGVGVLMGALAAYGWLDGPLWLLLVLFLAPDVSMLAYLAGPRIGSLGYNVVHVYVLPLALAGIGVWTTTPLAVQLAAIWLAHIGADRVAGYGLKYETGFKDTHLGVSPVTAGGNSNHE